MLTASLLWSACQICLTHFLTTTSGRYVLEFQKLLDRTSPVPYATILRTIEAELGRPATEVFTSIDPQPLASASVAQVHAAVLKGSNKQVVLKVGEYVGGHRTGR
jgi:predicted unusual protein kinase regulating ubiquinone biosynthesis (AarF/ABC1/UbiB family)